ncbi:hypothetical protein CORC01_08864 [Colletotrichum orchidophilum]|uniref:Uncharacterized protein n=1 Tax=Colletotrichum orchidophilum TaxID=1209926 RepID=A0A1G4B394_9PEZI|nr:uncharacterized protein CORC01_08864 [Colletotrichum orchidophilum]OHE95867.1 hypothetical protein CORC01_08864 [Colletotrichum orchidophilum]
MQFFTIVALLAPLALTETTWLLTGTCLSDNTCGIDSINHSNTTDLCNNTTGRFNGKGNEGKTSCTPANTPCSYVWTC